MMKANLVRDHDQPPSLSRLLFGVPHEQTCYWSVLLVPSSEARTTRPFVNGLLRALCKQIHPARRAAHHQLADFGERLLIRSRGKMLR
jgi:hypothetical protein